MLARTWRGVTKAEDADAYLTYLHQTGLTHYRRTPGNLAAYCLRKVEDGRAESLLVTLWESMDAVKRFAGDTPERAIFFPEDDRYLIDRDVHVTHYEVPFAEGQAFVPQRVRFDDFRVAGPTGDLRLVDTGGGGGRRCPSSSCTGSRATRPTGRRSWSTWPPRAAGASRWSCADTEAPRSGAGGLHAGVARRRHLRVVRALGLRRFVLVGHSISGGVTLAYAGENPRQVAGLVLVDPMTEPRRTPTPSARPTSPRGRAGRGAGGAAGLGAVGGAPADVREQLLADLDATPLSAVAATRRSRADFDLTAALARYPGPKLCSSRRTTTRRKASTGWGKASRTRWWRAPDIGSNWTIRTR